MKEKEPDLMDKIGEIQNDPHMSAGEKQTRIMKLQQEAAKMGDKEFRSNYGCFKWIVIIIVAFFLIRQFFQTLGN